MIHASQTTVELSLLHRERPSMFCYQANKVCLGSRLFISVLHPKNLHHLLRQIITHPIPQSLNREASLFGSRSLGLSIAETSSDEWAVPNFSRARFQTRCRFQNSLKTFNLNQ